MRKAEIYFKKTLAGELIEVLKGKQYQFEYNISYKGDPISLTMPYPPNMYTFDTFPPFFDGLLPEGFQLEALLKQMKIDRDDLFSQLIVTGQDMVGVVTVKEISVNE